MLAPGSLIDRYELVCHVGDGATAQVWAARQRGPHGFEKLVALKIIHPRYAEVAAFRRMFIDEARLVSSLQHRNVALVFELGEASGLLYLVMEYVDGDSLFALLAAAPAATPAKVPIPVALRIAADACSGLHAAHEHVDPNGRARNIVHRDVSPHNLLLAANGDVKIIDFGVAYAQGRLAETSNIEAVKGRARFMAPEQARREALGPYTDVFGVGATLFWMLSGRAPYAADDDVATMDALTRRAPPLHALPSDIPSRVAEVIERAVAPSADDRFATARELGTALQTLLAYEPPPDIGRFVSQQLSPQAREKRALVQSRAAASASPASIRPATLGIPDDAQLGQRAPGKDGAQAAAASPPGSAPPRRATQAERESAATPTTSVSHGPSEPPAPGFMDVSALIARAQRNGGTLSDPPASAVDADGVPIELDTSKAKKAAPAKARARLSRAALIRIGVAAAVTIATLSVLALFLPGIVRTRAIAAAGEAGVALTIGDVGVGFSGVSLRNVTATIPSVPGLEAKIREVQTGLSGNDVRVLGLDLSLRGRRSDLGTSLGTFAALNRQRFAGSTSSPRHLSIVSARTTWDDTTGTRLEAGDIGVELDSHGAGVEEVKGHVGRFEVQSGAAVFGPWSSSFERNATNARARVMFDPAVPDGPAAFGLWAKGLPTQITVKIPRSSIVHLGIKPQELGIPANDATDVEVSLTAVVSENDRSDLTFNAAVWGLRPKGIAGAIDAKIEGAGAARPGKPFELEKTTVTFGPFVANVTGSVAVREGDLRLDATFKTLPMQCDKLVTAEAKRMGGWAATIEAFGQATRVLRVTGAVNASGIVKYDTASPEDAQFAWLTKETCGVSIFGM